MKPVGLLFFLAVSSIRSEEINLNDLVDKNVFRINEFLQPLTPNGIETIRDPKISDKYSFEYAAILGLDNVRRTGDCKIVKEGSNSTYELNFGLGFLVVVIPRLKYNGENMSAVLRVRNNSLYFSFNQIKGLRNITVNELAMKSLGQVEFWSSNPQYDGTDVEDIFENIKMIFNHLIDGDREDISRAATHIWYSISSKYPNGLFNEL